MTTAKISVEDFLTQLASKLDKRPGCQDIVYACGWASNFGVAPEAVEGLIEKLRKLQGLQAQLNASIVGTLEPQKNLQGLLSLFGTQPEPQVKSEPVAVPACEPAGVAATIVPVSTPQVENTPTQEAFPYPDWLLALAVIYIVENRNKRLDWQDMQVELTNFFGKRFVFERMKLLNKLCKFINQGVISWDETGIFFVAVQEGSSRKEDRFYLDQRPAALLKMLVKYFGETVVAYTSKRDDLYHFTSKYNERVRLTVEDYLLLIDAGLVKGTDTWVMLQVAGFRWIANHFDFAELEAVAKDAKNYGWTAPKNASKKFPALEQDIMTVLDAFKDTKWHLDNLLEVLSRNKPEYQALYRTNGHAKATLPRAMMRLEKQGKVKKLPKRGGFVVIA